MALKKDKQKVLGEVFDDARIKTFLQFQAPEGIDENFHLLEKAYRGMKAENFETFIKFFLEQGRNINAKGPNGCTILAEVLTHRQSEEYADILKAAGATEA